MIAPNPTNSPVSSEGRSAEGPRDGRAELSLGGLWFRWSSLGPRDKLQLALSLVCLFAAGVAAAATKPQETEWLGLLPLALNLAGLLLLFQFCNRQDELVRLVMLHGAAGAGYGAMAGVLTLMGLNQSLGTEKAGGLIIVLIGMLVGSVIATVRAHRKLVS